MGQQGNDFGLPLEKNGQLAREEMISLCRIRSI